MQVTKDVRGESLWELLYADNLVIIAKSEEQVVRRFNEWKRELEMRFEGEYEQDKNDGSGKGASSETTERQIPVWSLWGRGGSEFSLVPGMFKMVSWEMFRTQT